MYINQFMNRGISSAVKTAARFYLLNPTGRKYIDGLTSAFLDRAKKREEYERKGIHVPPYLIAGITSACNLHCTGCYARAGGFCREKASDRDMEAAEWTRIIKEASDLGVSIVLLAGGEPLTRRDIIEVVSGFTEMVFPIFTNGTLIDDEYVSFFNKHRNLIPVMSIEGNFQETNRRRGRRVAEKVQTVAQRLKERGILFGTSITVTGSNLDTVTDIDFVKDLEQSGFGIVFYVEYVPAESGTGELVLTQEQCSELNDRVNSLREKFKKMIIVSFPGDEDEMGGCLASGRGFFHINSLGGAELCPFSPYSKHNLKECSILDVLQSEYFKKIRELETGAMEL